MNKKTIRDINLKKKRVLVRVDYNVSLLPDFKIGDDLRIKQSLQTINYLFEQNCTIFLVCHLGRPGGRVNLKYSLAPVRLDLQRLLGKKVSLIKNYIDGPGREAAQKAKPATINLLENIRFYPEETANDLEFAWKLANLAEVFVFDAFGTAHRIHASTVGVTKYLPSVAGLLLEKEINILNQAIKKPKRPFVVIIGGAKTRTKIPLIKSLIGKADILLIDGGVGNTFLRAKGYAMGKSLIDEGMLKIANKIIKQARSSKTQIILAEDLVIGSLKKGSYKGAVLASKIPSDLEALDIGPKTEVKFGQIIAQAKTIIWNGPMGVFELPEFARGTNFIYQAIAANRDSLSIIGGGETLTALPKEEYLETIDHISTGGGAMLEFIEKGTLPAIEALEEK